MDYNTQRAPLVISEYGRNIQQMVQLACTIEDRETRNKVAREIVEVMAQITPQQKDLVDLDQKLWTHLFIISDFKLDVDSPVPIPDKRAFFSGKPEKIPYPDGKIKYRHYGKIVEEMITKASKMESGEDKDAFVEVIANLMKKSYLSWNRDSVNDQMIIDHLEQMSGEKIKVKADFILDSTRDILFKNKKKKKPGKTQNGGYSGHKNKQRSNYRKNNY
jgi:hypothetical protein